MTARTTGKRESLSQRQNAQTSAHCQSQFAARKGKSDGLNSKLLALPAAALPPRLREPDSRPGNRYARQRVQWGPAPPVECWAALIRHSFLALGPQCARALNHVVCVKAKHKPAELFEGLSVQDFGPEVVRRDPTHRNKAAAAQFAHLKHLAVDVARMLRRRDGTINSSCRAYVSKCGLVDIGDVGKRTRTTASGTCD